MSGCETCDFIGPDETKTQAELRELHRAIYQFTEALVGPISDWQMRVLDRVMEARAKGLPFRTVLTRQRGRR